MSDEQNPKPPSATVIEFAHWAPPARITPEALDALAVGIRKFFRSALLAELREARRVAQASIDNAEAIKAWSRKHPKADRARRRKPKD